ncbi:hypothetical protein JCM3770_000132 [Rhodotorula araucariae]
MRSAPAPTGPLAFDYSQPCSRLDADDILERVNRDRQQDLDHLEQLLDDVYVLRDELIVSIYNRVTKLQFEQRDVLLRLFHDIKQGEAAEALEKQKLMAFVDGISAAFARLCGSASPAPFARCPNALISIDPHEVVSPMDGDALVDKTRVGESADLDALEELLKCVHELFDDYAAAMVRYFDALDAQQAKDLNDAIDRNKQQEDEQEEHRQSIATLFNTVRSAFEHFQAFHAQH